MISDEDGVDVLSLDAAKAEGLSAIQDLRREKISEPHDGLVGSWPLLMAPALYFSRLTWTATPDRLARRCRINFSSMARTWVRTPRSAPIW